MDITILEVRPNDFGLNELEKASSGTWGGTLVDQSFKEMIETLVTPRILETYALENMADYIEMFRNFERSRQKFINETVGKITVRIPISLKELYENETGIDVTDSIKSSKYKNDVIWIADKMRITNERFKGFFKAALDSIIDHLKKFLHSPNYYGTNNILMVGVFSESPLLQQVVKTAFPQCRVFIPQEPGKAVLKGAVLFGHTPPVPIVRIRYGIHLAFYREQL